MPLGVDTIVAVAGLVITAAGAVAKARHDRMDARRKQVELATRMYNELQQDEYSMAALLMLDYPGLKHTIKGVGEFVIDYDDVRSALSNPLAPPRLDEESAFVRRSFDVLFAKLENTLVLIDSPDRLLRWQDFSALFGAYLYTMRQGHYSSVLYGYARRYGFANIVELIQNDVRYPIAPGSLLKSAPQSRCT